MNKKMISLLNVMVLSLVLAFGFTGKSWADTTEGADSLPPAGTIIPNVAEVICEELGTLSVTSNIAKVIVKPVYGTRLIAMDEVTTTVNVGETASSTVALVNTGNATSTYTLQAAGENVVLKDADGTPLVDSVVLAGGEIFPVTLEVIPQSRGTMALGLSATANVPDDGWGDPENVEYLTHLKVTGPDISIVKEVNVASARPGDEVTYTLTVTNNGDGIAHDVVIQDMLPEDVELVSVCCENGLVSYSEGMVTVEIDVLQPGEEVEVKIEVKITIKIEIKIEQKNRCPATDTEHQYFIKGKWRCGNRAGTLEICYRRTRTCTQELGHAGDHSFGEFGPYQRCRGFGHPPRTNINNYPSEDAAREAYDGWEVTRDP